MVRENVLTTDDLIWPLFVIDGTRLRTPVPSMPDVERLSIDEAVRAVERAAKLTIPCVALFPYTDPALRDDDGSEALNPDNLVCRAIRAIKKEVPEIGVLCDVALDPYTSHGHDGLLSEGVILNDETVAVLVRQALVRSRRRLRRDRAVRHDGRPCRRHPLRTRRRGLRRCADHGLCGQIRIGLLRTVPRCGRFESHTRPATNEPIRWIRRIPTRRCARWSSTSPKAPTW